MSPFTRGTGDWTFLGVTKPRWERGRPVRNRGRRPLQRPLAAPGRARRPRSQRGHVKHTLRVESVCSANEAHPWVGSVFGTAAGSEGRRSRARRRFGSDDKAGNLIQSLCSATETKRRRRVGPPSVALSAQSKDSLDCASKTSNLQGQCGALTSRLNIWEAAGHRCFPIAPQRGVRR